MPIEVITRTSLLSLIAIALVGCDSSKLKLTGEVAIPYMTECARTVKVADEYYKRQFDTKKGRIEINVMPFTPTFLKDFGVDGLLNISAFGDLGLLNNYSSYDYVRGLADSIAAECLPDVGITVKEVSYISKMADRIKSEFGGPVLPIINDGEITILYNKKDTTIDHWRQ